MNEYVMIIIYMSKITPVRPETCRGKRIADTVCRRKRIVYGVGNKEK
jgi:hypothetical protein